MTDRPIRIVLADDHSAVRARLRKLIESEKDFKIVAEVSSGRELLETVGEVNPDIVLLDLNIPGMSGIEVLQAMRSGGVRGKTILLTASGRSDEWIDAMKSGCSGILVKESPPELILKSIRKVHEGQVWLDAQTTAAVMAEFASPDERPIDRRRKEPSLSKREREIVALITQGYRNRELAEKLFISEQTVKNHLHNIFDKVGVSDRLQLALLAIHRGIHLNAESN